MIDRFFKETADDISVQVFRYVLAGTLAYIVDYSVLIILTEVFKVYYLASAAMAFILGAVVSYALNVSWVFNERVFKSKSLEFSLFFMIGIGGLFLNHYCILFFTEAVKLHYLVSKLVSSIVISAVNFSARKYMLFR